MTAGRGIVHSEMPGGDGDNIGLQLWINLKSKDKVSLVSFKRTITKIYLNLEFLITVCEYVVVVKCDNSIASAKDLY